MLFFESTMKMGLKSSISTAFPLNYWKSRRIVLTSGIPRAYI